MCYFVFCLLIQLSERKGVTLEAKISVSGKTGITIKSQIKKEVYNYVLSISLIEYVHLHQF